MVLVNSGYHIHKRISQKIVYSLAHDLKRFASPVLGWKNLKNIDYKGALNYLPAQGPNFYPAQGRNMSWVGFEWY